MRRRIISNTKGDHSKIEVVEMYLNIITINLTSEKKPKNKEVIVNPEETVMKYLMRSGDLRKINRLY